MFELRLREIYRYLGFRGTEPPAYTVKRIQQCVDRMYAAMTLRTTHRKFPVSVKKPDTVEIAGLTIHSRNLCKNLDGCDQAYMFAATVGVGIDRLIKRGEIGGMIDALIYQAAGAEMIEAYADELNGALRRTEAKQGCRLRPRFSPGYGDVPLALQKDFSRILELPKTCGITLTDTLLMVPSKSVTAFIGCTKKFDTETEDAFLADVANPLDATGKSAAEASGTDTVSGERENKCRRCTKNDCQFRN